VWKILTPIPPRLQTIKHVLFILTPLHAQDNQIRQIAIQIHFLLRERRFLGCFRCTRQHHSCGPLLHRATRHVLRLWLLGGGTSGRELARQRLALILRGCEGIGEFLVFSGKTTGFLCRGSEVFLQGCESRGTGLEVGELRF